MTVKNTNSNQSLPSGVIFNAYPDSIGRTLSDTMRLLEHPQMEGAFSLFYVLPTFFNSDLDRGFSVIDYNTNDELVEATDLEKAAHLGLGFKFDLVLNHMSVGSSQFLDMVQNGDKSQYRDFFIDWNEFWSGHGEMGPEGYIVPEQKHLDRLFMRKPELPILKVRFPDGSERPYWNTFYQEVNYQPLTIDDLAGIDGLPAEQAEIIMFRVNTAIAAQEDIRALELDGYRDELVAIVEQKRQYLGQMDLNARSEKVWEFYDETLTKLAGYGSQLVRLDAFAYLHKAVGETNFFNRPGTWKYLERLKRLASIHGLTLLPEIHAEYGSSLHEEVARNGFPVYDFFLPGLVIDALDREINTHLLRWIRELDEKGIRTVNMLGCHDGIPVLDLRGMNVDGVHKEGLLSDGDIEAIIDKILARGGRIKNLYGGDGKKIAYYQVNATYFSALGEDEQKLLLARAIQLFTPGIPQVWYLDLFAGKNDYAAADRGGTGGHKEINRTTLSMADVKNGLDTAVVRDQLKLLKLRNTHPAFLGKLEITETEPHRLHLTWRNGAACAILEASLRGKGFTVTHSDSAGNYSVMRFGR